MSRVTYAGQLTDFLREEIMRVMQAHRGRAHAIPRRDLWARLSLFKPDLTDRDMRELYSSLPICSCSEGLFLPQSVAEVLEFRDYIRKAWGPIVAHRRCATIYAFYKHLIPPMEQKELPL